MGEEFGPPADVVPGIVPVELILARTPQRAIGLTGIRANPVGFGCTLHLRLREIIPGEQSNFGAFNMFDEGVDPAGGVRRLLPAFRGQVRRRAQVGTSPAAEAAPNLRV